MVAVGTGAETVLGRWASDAVGLGLEGPAMSRGMFGDVVATVAVAAIAVPYAGYLLYGGMPYLQDPRGMAAMALVLGGVAFAAAWWGTGGVGLARAEVAIATLALAIGITTLILAESSFAGSLLAAFMATGFVAWLIVILNHVLRGAGFGEPRRASG